MKASSAQVTSEPFADVLRDLRLAAGLSQESLAELAHMSSGGVSVLERGTRRAPHRDTVALLAEALRAFRVMTVLGLCENLCLRNRKSSAA